MNKEIDNLVSFSSGVVENFQLQIFQTLGLAGSGSYRNAQHPSACNNLTVQRRRTFPHDVKLGLSRAFLSPSWPTVPQVWDEVVPEVKASSTSDATTFESKTLFQRALKYITSGKCVALSEALAMVKCAIHYVQSAEGCDFVEPSLFRYRGYRIPRIARYPELPTGLPLHRAKFLFIHYAIEVVQLEYRRAETNFMANLYLRHLVGMCQILQSRATLFEALRRVRGEHTGPKTPRATPRSCHGAQSLKCGHVSSLHINSFKDVGQATTGKGTLPKPDNILSLRVQSDAEGLQMPEAVTPGGHELNAVEPLVNSPIQSSKQKAGSAECVRSRSSLLSSPKDIGNTLEQSSPPSSRGTGVSLSHSPVSAYCGEQENPLSFLEHPEESSQTEAPRSPGALCGQSLSDVENMGFKLSSKSLPRCA